MGKTRNRVLILVAFTLLLAVLVGSFSTASTPYKMLGAEFKQTVEDESVLANVGGTAITQHQVNTIKYGMKIMEAISQQTNNNNQFIVSDQEILNHLIEQRILFLQAVEEGVEITGDELDRYLESYKEVFSNASSDDVSAKAARDYAAGQDMSIEEYIDSLRPIYEIELSASALKALYVKDIQDKEEAERKWNQIRTKIIEERQGDVAR